MQWTAKRIPTYRVESRRLTEPQRHAVIRTGPLGGTKVIGVWINESVAAEVRELLEINSGLEA